ncbi:oxygenase MpaB family protein [Rhodococcus sp. NPDC127528]|uniref:oxygenase MpaB family protein n=1 Tax=unclassified Rhodococcus (in: high G+C Gram-positive bacteria) TaxID=192944 RepID=UPI003629E876
MLLTDGGPAPRGRYGWLRRIEQLDPIADHQEIHRITAGFEFPWDYTRSLELALFRTYCVPTISALLRKTGEFEKRPQKRYDDTALLMAELVEHGYDSARGRESLRVVNRMHGRYDIDNADMLYVLTTFIYEPLDWIDRYGWRRLHPNERLAAFHFYREVGLRMGIREIPDDFQELYRFKTDYEHDHFRYTDDNHAIGTYTRDLFCSWFPRVIRPAVGVGVNAMLDPMMLSAFGFRAAPAWIRSAADVALVGRARVLVLFPRRARSKSTHQPGNRTYPGYPVGYRPSDLGTDQDRGRH